MRFLYTILFAALICLPASATIINIPGDYETIQEGIDASTDGDTVLVQPGTYVENIFFNGHNAVLGSLFLTTEDPSYIYSTIIDGGMGGTVLSFWDGEDSTTIVTGFTIRNGRGGISAEYSDPIIKNNTVRDNISSAYMNGGGIKCVHSSAVIANNLIINNSSQGSGGGIDCANSDVTIINNIIRGNTADGAFGGGILFCNYCDAEIWGNIIEQNQAAREGGGIWFARSDGKLTNNIIRGNLVSSDNYGFGGGVACKLGSNPTIANNVITENTAFSASGSGFGGGFWCYYSFPLVTNNVFWANTADEGDEIYLEGSVSNISYCDIQGGSPGKDNIDLDPLFRDPENGDFHLMSTACGDPYDSPCIDVGHPDILDSLLDCSWGLGTVLSDMGVYGGGESEIDYSCNYVPGDVNHNGIPLELVDAIAMIAVYRGVFYSYYICDCGNIENFSATADPDGNCIANELSDVVTEIAAYRGSADVSSCPDCPGALRLIREHDDSSP